MFGHYDLQGAKSTNVEGRVQKERREIRRKKSPHLAWGSLKEPGVARSINIARKLNKTITKALMPD